MVSKIKITIAQRNPRSRTKKNTICARKYFHEFGLSDNYEITSHLYPSFCFAPAPYHQERESKAPGQDEDSVSPDTFLHIGINSTKLKLTDNLFVPIYLYVVATFLQFFCCWLWQGLATKTRARDAPLFWSKLGDDLLRRKTLRKQMYRLKIKLIEKYINTKAIICQPDGVKPKYLSHSSHSVAS